MHQSVKKMTRPSVFILNIICKVTFFSEQVILMPKSVVVQQLRSLRATISYRHTFAYHCRDTQCSDCSCMPRQLTLTVQIYWP